MSIHTYITKKIFFLTLILLFFGFFAWSRPVSAASCCLKVVTDEDDQIVSNTCFTVTADEPCLPPTKRHCSRGDLGLSTCQVTTLTPTACNRHPELCNVGAADERVDCSKVMNSNDPTDKQREACLVTANCFYAGGKCLDRYSSEVCTMLPQVYCGTNEGTKPTICQWNIETSRCLPALENTIGSQYGKSNEGDILSTCALQGNCRNINDLFVAFIRILKFAFGIAGSLAFAAFIYGGLMMIVSFGNADKIEQGKSAIVAAVVGLAIAFSAYVLIGYVLQVFEVGSDFRII